ncbi:MAG: response regulator transcription factor [bacterium]
MSKGKVLIVDDEPDIIRAISMRLKAEGYDAVAAMDGMQAVNMAMKEHPDLIILDIGLPAGDGHSVVERLQASTITCTTPIIFLTARTSEEDYKKAMSRGVNRYITKPFDPQELISCVASLITGVTIDNQKAN